VRDGGGVTPDSIISEEATYNIAGYLYLKNLYFKYANQYVASHPAIAPASQFQLTDDEYNDFCKFVIQSGFTYRLESEKYLQDLKKMVKTEGYDTKTDSLFTQLTNLLQPNVADDLTLFRNDVQEMLEMEIIKRYYYQEGTIEYSLRHDDWLKTAISIIQKNIDEIK
jgi:carboxyl-terminal processing protease